MVQSWGAWHGTQSPALCIPHSSQPPVNPLEVWLEHGLQAILSNKTSDNSALRVQRGCLFLRIVSLVSQFSTSCKSNAKFISSSSPLGPSHSIPILEGAGNSEPARESQCSACNPKISVLQGRNCIAWVTLGQGE